MKMHHYLAKKYDLDTDTAIRISAPITAYMILKRTEPIHTLSFMRGELFGIGLVFGKNKELHDLLMRLSK